MQLKARTGEAGASFASAILHSTLCRSLRIQWCGRWTLSGNGLVSSAMLLVIRNFPEPDLIFSKLSHKDRVSLRRVCWTTCNWVGQQITSFVVKDWDPAAPINCPRFWYGFPQLEALTIASATSAMTTSSQKPWHTTARA